ncbi:hypothetical protein JCM19294_2493 [Nonlabens tegetincola]|uniref:Uncharacterized protein n=1 Tax=Nonlabens tegetincola TaxID=323273 RepID=A0A090QJJ3_9FLAO|nr:hypothetical protein JCM19294_2493 [Nonlabens tegetincola]
MPFSPMKEPLQQPVSSSTLYFIKPVSKFPQSQFFQKKSLEKT